MSAVQPATSDVDVDLGRLLVGLARNWLRILVVAILLSGLAFVVASLLTPHYRAETRLLIETRESVFTRPQATDSDRMILDEEGVTSQVEVISSADLLKQVAKTLNLAALPEFDDAAQQSPVTRLMILAGLRADPGELAPEERVLNAMRERLSVYRIEKSRVIVIGFSSEDPKLAAEVPNAIADAYLSFSRQSKEQSTSAATDWLEPEIASLTKRVKEAEERVAAFRAESDLSIGQNNGALATQQLSELSSELSRVRANRAAAEANAERVRAVTQSGGSLEAFPEVLSSGLIQRLRDRQVQLKADIADLSVTLLDNHPRIRALRSQLSDLETQIRSEARTVLQGLVNEAQAAQSREQQLVADLNRLKAESARVSEKEVEARALEREATAQRDLLESYLVRYREASSRRDGDYLPADARIFSRAGIPQEPYFPKVMPIVGATFAGSILLMAIATLLSELFSGRAMRPAGTSHLAPVDEVRMPDGPQDPNGTGARRRPPVQPKSRLGEMDIRGVAEQLIARGATRALIVSPEGDEGAASSVLIAREIADAGLRALLVDLTTSGAASLPMLDGESLPGMTDLLSASAQFADIIHTDRYSDCHVIPSGTADPLKAMRAIDRLPIVLDSLTTAYDLVLVECGPANVESIRRLVTDSTEVLVSMLEAGEDVVAARDDLVAAGFTLTLVTPLGHRSVPEPGRNAA